MNIKNRQLRGVTSITPPTRTGNQSPVARIVVSGLAGIITLIAITPATGVGLAGVGLAISGRSRTHSQSATPAAHQDIREIFLTVPVPDEEGRAKVPSDPGQRKLLLERTDFTKSENILDVTNGYLRIEIAGQSDPSPADPIRILVTYFTKSNGDRLVVVQKEYLGGPEDNPVMADRFYLLARGKYTPLQASQCLPPITFFGDFWGSQPRPDKQVRNYAASEGDARFYYIEWPRHGRVARAHSILPYWDADGVENERNDRILGKRQFKDLELIWDRDRGVFVKGAKTRNHPASAPRDPARQAAAEKCSLLCLNRHPVLQNFNAATNSSMAFFRAGHVRAS